MLAKLSRREDELAAALALENRDYELARVHIEALTRIEPDRPQHEKRLEAITRLIGKKN